MNYLLILFFISGCAIIATSPVPTGSPSPEPVWGEPLDPSPTPSPLSSPGVAPSPSITPTAHPSPSPSPKPNPSPSSIAIDHSAVTLIPAGDIASYLVNAKAGDYLQLVSGRAYFLGSTVTVKADHLTLDLGGNAIPMTVTPGSGSDIVLATSAHHFTLRNGTVTKAYTPMLRSHAAYTTIEDIRTNDIKFGADGKQSDGVNQFYLGDSGSTHSLIQRVHVGHCGTVCLYYTGDDMVIRDSEFTGSYGEYNIRSETIVPTILPHRALISNIVCDNRINQYGKSCVGIRMGAEATIENSLFHGYLALGQGKNITTLGGSTPNFIVRNVVFDDVRDPQLSVNLGSTGLIENCTFLRYKTPYPPVAIAPNTTTSSVVMKNNTIKRTDTTVVSHGLAGDLSKSTTKVTESGTRIIQ